MTKEKKSKTIVELREVWKEYHVGEETVYALRGLNLKVNEGEFVAIQGPSGSGKSTAMHLVGCLDIPSKGNVLLDGIDISTLSESSLAQIRGQKIGFIFQKFNLINTITAIENIMLPMSFLGVPEDERYERAMELLHLVDLEDRKNHLPTELSGGQQQRIAIARSLANDPNVILADEPTGNLDSKMGKIIMEFLQKLHKEGKTIVMVTHDDHLAQFAQRVEVLKDGQLVSTQKGKYHDKIFEEKRR
ncbi:ABC transporter ATP-binding protein [Candidatus Woesearchaeota archaeon]|nr:ABC transporter ATP-binding protein [Candidatus Woesearchaeota archaeon]